MSSSSSINELWIKQNKKHKDTENRVVATTGGGSGREGEMGKRDANQILGREHIVGYTEVEI